MYIINISMSSSTSSIALNKLTPKKSPSVPKKNINIVEKSWCLKKYKFKIDFC